MLNKTFDKVRYTPEEYEKCYNSFVILTHPKFKEATILENTYGNVVIKFEYEIDGTPISFERELKKGIRCIGDTIDISHSYVSESDFKKFMKCIICKPNLVINGKFSFFDCNVTIAKSQLPKCNFTAAIFRKDVNFSGSKFLENANFSKSNFSGNTNFSGSKFLDNVNFSDSKFSRDVDFSGSKFLDNANFSKSNFSGNTNLSFSEFSDEADFSGSKFSREVDFSDSKFSGNTNFSGSKFSDEADFSGSKFSRMVNFSNSEFKRLDIRDMYLAKGCKINWDKLNAKQRKRDMLLKRKRVNCKLLNFNSGIFLILKENYRRLGQYDWEDEAYVEYKRERKREKGGLSKNLPSLMDVIGEYGTNHRLVACWMLLIPLIFGIIYTLIIECGSGISIGADTSKIAIWIGSNEYGLGGFYLSGITFLTIGFSDMYPIEALPALLVIIEGFLGLFLMAYFTISFTRKILR